MKMSHIALISKPFPDLAAIFKTVFAEVKTVKRTEFYAAKSIGIIPNVIFSILTLEYNNENWIEYDGTIWKLIRAVDVKNNRTELTCNGIELGGFNCKISIFRPTFTPNLNGFPIKENVKIGKFYAYKEERPDTFVNEADGIKTFKNTVFRFEKGEDFPLDNYCEIEYNGLKYKVESVTEIPGRELFVEVLGKGFLWRN